MKRKIFKDIGIFDRRNEIGIQTGGSLRVKIIVIFIVLFMIVIFYHTYFEEPTKEEFDQIPKLAEINQIEIFNNYSNKSIRLSNPTIAMKSQNHYLIVFEKLESEGLGNIWLSNSKDGIEWSAPKLLFGNLSNIRSPYLEYIKDEFYILFFIHNNSRYISTSTDGETWSTYKPSELYYKNESVYYSEDYFLITNKTGLWRFLYKEFQTNNTEIGEQLISDDLSNASICHVNKYKFIIVYDNSSIGHSAIILTALLFEPIENGEAETKWDLLVIFVILGFILIFFIIQEVARD